MAVRHHIKVLVVDDEETVCSTVALILEEAGYKPLTFQSPIAALQAAREEACQIALIDQRMPELDGIKVVEQLKQIDERICCILMTAYPDLASATASMREGACDYITKPFKREQLLASLDRACQRLGLIYKCEGDLNKLIGQRIRDERIRQNLTLRQISERSDLTTSQLSQVELGKNAASMWALARISNALGMQLSQLIQGL